MSLLNFKIFRDAMGFNAAIFPYRQIVFDAKIKKGQHILLYGDVSKTLIKRTLEAIGIKGCLYVIGRSDKITSYQSLGRGKYQNTIVINPYFNTIPANSLHHILIANATLNWQAITPFALIAKEILVETGSIVIIDDQIPFEDLINLSKNIAWLKLVEKQKLLIFEKTKESEV